MTINTTPAPISGPAAAGPPGPQGLWPEGEWAAGTKIKNTVLSHNNRVWVANKTTTQEPSDSASDWDLWIDAQGAELAGAYAEAADVASVAAASAKSAAEAARDSAIAAERRMRTQSLGTFANDAAAVAWAAAQTPPITIVTGSSYLNSTTDVFRYAVVSAGPTITWHDVTEDEAAQAALATASASAAAASLQDFLNRYVGAFSSAPTYVGGSPPWVNGALYWNTLAGKFKVWTGATWVDSDATAQQAATDATGARDAIYGFWCGAAAADPTTKIGGGALTTACIYFNTVSGKLRTYATGVWRDYDKDAQDAAALATSKASDANAAKVASEAARDAAAGSATGAGNSKAAVDASLLQAISYAALAQAGAASVSAQTGLSILAAAQRAIKLTTAGVAICAYDVTKDDFGGNNWPLKANASYQTEALNTATRGAVANFPTQAFILGETTVLSAFVGIDNTGPLLKSWTVAGLTCVFARNGSIWYGGTGGLYRIDLISDEVYKRDAAGLYKADQNVASYNQGTAVWTLVSSAGAIASATVNSIAATIAPNTPLNPLRCNLPNPTVAVGTASGVSVIRADGVVCSSSATFSAASVSFDQQGNLWTAQAGANLHVTRPASYLAASFSINALVYWSEVAIGVGTLKAVNASGPVAVVCGDAGLARIKLDPANPANSLINIKTTTYDTGWMVLGKTVLAMAESSQALATLTAAQVVTNSTFATDLSGWTAADVGTGYASAWNTGGGIILPRDGTAANYGRRYQQVTLPALAGGNISITCTGGEVNCYIGSVALTNDVAQILTSGGAAKKSFTVPASGVVYITLLATANATSPVVTSITCDVGAKDVSGSGNGPKAVGAPPRAIVAPGADTAGVGGFGAGAYLEGPNVLNGLTDCAIRLKWAHSATAYEGAVSWGDTSTYANDVAAIRFVSGSLYATVRRGGSLVNASLAFTPLGTTVFRAMWLVCRGTRLELWLDSRMVASGTISASAFSNGSAVSRIGCDLAGNWTTGNIALAQFLSYAPTPDQIAFMDADEKGRFAANAQSLLTGANVQGVAWCPDTDTYGAPNSTDGCDVFKGSVRVANDNSATGSTNLLSNAQIPAAWTYTRSSLGNLPSGVTVSAWPGGAAWALVEDATASSTHTTAPVASAVLANTTAYALGIPMQQAGRGYAKVTLSGAVAASFFVNLATGAVSNTTNCTGLSPVAINGGFQIGVTFTTSSAAALTVTMASATGTATGNDTLSGSGAAAFYFGKPQLNLGATLATYMDGLSQSANAKAVAMAQGKVAVITAAGVDVWIPAAPGQRETAEGVGASKRAVYDPTFSISTFRTSDATPSVGVSSICPEGKAYRVRDTVSFVQTGGAATEKAAYVVEALVTRDLGGNVVVVSTTTTISETTASLDYVIAANTTAQTYEGVATGKAATPGMWTVEREVYDAGLMMAA